MQVWNLLHAARCKYRRQKSRQKSPSGSLFFDGLSGHVDSRHCRPSTLVRVLRASVDACQSKHASWLKTQSRAPGKYAHHTRIAGQRKSTTGQLVYSRHLSYFDQTWHISCFVWSVTQTNDNLATTTQLLLWKLKTQWKILVRRQIS